MACSRSLRLGGAISALIFAAFAGAAEASDPPCSDAGGVKMQDARLVVAPNIATNSTQLTFSGHALISDADKVGVTPAHALCLSAVGSKFSVNRTAICGLLYGLSGRDTLKPAGDGVEFALSTTLVQQGQEILIEQPAGESICASPLTIEVRLGPQGHFGFVTGLPKALASDHVEFEVAPGVRSKPLNIQAVIFEDQAVAAGTRAVNAPKSWNEPIEGLRLQWLAHALLLSIALALFLTLFEKVHPPQGSFGSVWVSLEAPLTAAMAFYTAGALMECIGTAAYTILRLRPGTETIFGRIGDAVRTVSRELGVINLNAPVELALVVAVFVAVLIAYLVVRLVCGRGPVGRAIVFPFQVTVCAAAISAAGLVFAIAVLLTEKRLPWFGFEPPALVISAFYALIGVWSLRRLFGLSKKQVIWIALLIAVTALFPTDSVLKSSLTVAIGDNTRIWARFICSFTGDFIYIAALTGFAFRVADSDELSGTLAAQWLVLLLILLLAAFSFGNPTNTVALAGVLAVSSRWLLASSGDQVREGVTTSGEAIDWEQEEEVFPLIVGAVAAFIFLVQFTFRTGGNDFSHRFALLALAGVPRMFALGAVAALILSRCGPCLRGDSATLKAVNISVLIMLTNIAASLATLQGRLIAVLVANLGVIASLILSALIVYDLQSARTSDGQLAWRDLFKGTTLAQGVPIISAVAVALFSAIGPIFITEFSDTVGTLLKNALSQIQGAS